MREMKFVCGACGEFSKKAYVSRHVASYVAHEECGYETFFPNFVAHKDPRGKAIFDPVGTLVRPIGEKGDGMPVSEFKEYLKAGRVKVPFERKKPSASDLDLVMEERKIAVVNRLYTLGLTPESVKEIVEHFGADKLYEAAAAGEGALEDLLEEFQEEKDDANDAVKRVNEFDLGGPPNVHSNSDERQRHKLAVERLVSTGMSKSEAKRLVKQKGPDKVLETIAGRTLISPGGAA